MKKLLHKIKAHSKKGFGIHSPFVYNFQKEVLNSPQRLKGKDKIQQLALRMLAYFDLKTPLLLKDKFCEEFFIRNIPYYTSPEEVGKYDMVLMDSADCIKKEYLAEKAFVILEGKHQEILKNPLRKNCEVFIDLYYIAICVFRKGLSKQEFKLKF